MKPILLVLSLFVIPILLTACGNDRAANQEGPLGSKIAATLAFSCDGFVFSKSQIKLMPDPNGTGGQGFGVTNEYVDSSTGVDVWKTYCKENYKRSFSADIYRDGGKTTKTLHFGMNAVPSAGSIEICNFDIPQPLTTGQNYSCQGSQDGISFTASLQIN